MPVTPTYPGVYIQEIPSGVRTIAGVATSITAFIGRARRGPINDPVRIASFGDYIRTFGDLWTQSTMGYAVMHYFQNGGTDAIIVRIQRDATPGEHSVILTPHREAFYNREKLVNHPVGKDSPWDKLRFSRYPRFVQENNGTTCAKTSISALTSGLMTSKHVCLTRQAPYPRSATWCGSYAKTSRAVSLKRCSTMLTHRSTTERRPLVPSVSGASRLALP